MTKYVCGFLFDRSLSLVVLIEKLRPAWQNGHWNGVGGHIEPGETPLQAMVREFNEEAGLVINDWTQFCIMSGQDFEVTFYYSVIDEDKIMNIKTMTDEKLGIWPVDRAGMLEFPVLPNLRWLLPMALISANGRKEIFNIYIDSPEK
jgi:8-oxo-dGTP diphosphatase